MNGMFLKLVFGACLMAFVSLQTWGLVRIEQLGQVTARLDQRLISMGAQMERINIRDDRIDVLERQVGALRRRR